MPELTYELNVGITGRTPRCARQGQKHVGSPRFARYYSLRIFARYAGVIRHG